MIAALEENNKLGLGSAMHHAQLSVAKWNVLNSARAGLTSWNIGMVFQKHFLTIKLYKIIPRL
jgi:hypothetical protein